MTKTCVDCGYFIPNKCKALFKARLATDNANDCTYHYKPFNNSKETTGAKP